MLKQHRAWKMMRNLFVVILLVIFEFSNGQGILKQCPDYQIHFEKILGYRPPLPSSLYELKVLHKSYQVLPTVINLHCLELCKNDHNCDSYVLNFNKSECYGFTSNDRILDNLNYRLVDDHELVEDIGVVYFVKTCLNSEYFIFFSLKVILSIHASFKNMKNSHNALIPSFLGHHHGFQRVNTMSLTRALVRI